MCSLPDLTLGCWTPVRVCTATNREGKIKKRMCVLKFTENIYAWILLMRAWSFGHLYSEEDEKMQLFLWTFFYIKICINVSTSSERWSRLGRKRAVYPHTQHTITLALKFLINLVPFTEEWTFSGREVESAYRLLITLYAWFVVKNITRHLA